MTILGIEAYDALVILAYFVILLGIGFWSRRYAGTYRNFVSTGSKVGVAVSLLYGIAFFINGPEMATVVGHTYYSGFPGWWWIGIWCLITPFYVFIAPIWRRARLISQPEVVEARSDAGLAMINVILGIMGLLSWVAMFMVAVGGIFHGITGIDPVWWMIMCGVIVLIYSLLGGLPAAVITNIFQAVLTLAAFLFLVPSLYKASGGVSGWKSTLPPEFFSFANVDLGYSVYWLVTMGIFFILFGTIQPLVYSPSQLSRDEEGAVANLGLGHAIKRLWTMVFIVVGFSAAAMWPGQDLPPEAIVGMSVVEVLPVGLVGLFIASILAALMSTMDGLGIYINNWFQRSIYQRYIKPDASSQHYMFVSRVVLLLTIVIGLALAIVFKGVVEIIEFMASWFAIMLAAIYGGLFWRRANRYGMWASIFGSLALRSFVDIVLGWGFLDSLWVLMISQFALLIIVSKLTPPDPEDKLDAFYIRINTPVGKEKVLDECGIQYGERADVTSWQATPGQREYRKKVLAEIDKNKVFGQNSSIYIMKLAKWHKKYLYIAIVLSIIAMFLPYLLLQVMG